MEELWRKGACHVSESNLSLSICYCMYSLSISNSFCLYFSVIRVFASSGDLFELCVCVSVFKGVCVCVCVCV